MDLAEVSRANQDKGGDMGCLCSFEQVVLVTTAHYFSLFKQKGLIDHWRVEICLKMKPPGSSTILWFDEGFQFYCTPTTCCENVKMLVLRRSMPTAISHGLPFASWKSTRETYQSIQSTPRHYQAQRPGVNRLNWQLSTREIGSTGTPAILEGLDQTGHGRNKFYYMPLENDNSIRVLLLHGGQLDDSIRVTMVHGNVDNNVYEALSYRWDDPFAINSTSMDYELAITVNGVKREVTANLFSALRRVRHLTDDKCIWIDAICIDQNNAKEKERQVALMGRIYKNASKVVVWVGEENKWISAGVSVIKRWAELRRAESRLDQPVLIEKLNYWRSLPEEQACFESIARRAWFTRAWTFQEILLSRDAEIRCGKYVIPWGDFHDACAAVIDAGAEHFIFEEHLNVKTLYDYHIQRSRLLNRGEHDRDFNLSRLLQRTGLQETSNPRDRIYSLLGIANSPLSPDDRCPDYQCTVQEAYVNFTKSMIREDGDLTILSSVKHPHPEPTLEKIAQERKISATPYLPSWVPDFHYQDCVEYIIQDQTVRQDLPENMVRTRFPQLLSQPYNEMGSLPYWQDRTVAYEDHEQSRSVIFDTGKWDTLGVYGSYIDEIKEIKSFREFTTDPFVRTPAERRDHPKATKADESILSSLIYGGGPEESLRELKFLTDQFNWEEHFTYVKNTGVTCLEGKARYLRTGENLPIAILRTLSADMLPSSPRLSRAYKATHFPRHFDWFYWAQIDKLKGGRLGSGGEFYLKDFFGAFLDLKSIVSARWRRFASTDEYSKSWMAYDYGTLHSSERVYNIYESLLRVPSAKRPLLSFNFLDKFWFWVLVQAQFNLFFRDHIQTGVLAGMQKGYFFAGVFALIIIIKWYNKRYSKPNPSNPSVPPGMQLTRSLSGISNDVQWEMAVEVQNAINRASWNRLFYVTEKGYIGIGPVGMKSGDRVFSLVGAQVTFVLRRNPGSGGTWRLIGESYLHGFMDGEIWVEKGAWDSLDKMKSYSEKLILA
jgi:hypothetical protein